MKDENKIIGSTPIQGSGDYYDKYVQRHKDKEVVIIDALRAIFNNNSVNAVPFMQYADIVLEDFNPDVDKDYDSLIKVANTIATELAQRAYIDGAHYPVKLFDVHIRTYIEPEPDDSYYIRVFFTI